MNSCSSILVGLTTLLVVSCLLEVARGDTYGITLGFKCLCVPAEDFVDPYARVLLLDKDGKQTHSGQTEAVTNVWRTGKWAKNFTFEAGPDDMLEIVVMDEDDGFVTGGDDKLGTVKISPYKTAGYPNLMYPIVVNNGELIKCNLFAPKSIAKNMICDDVFKPELEINIRRLKSDPAAAPAAWHTGFKEWLS